ncbi:MAG: hypothetical protein ACK5VI_04285 [Opitutia bacterium]
MNKTPAPAPLVCPQVFADKLITLAMSRSAVRLDLSNYTDASQYRQDRREIEKQTARLRIAVRRLSFRMENWPVETSRALEAAAAGSRFTYDEMGNWQYTPGQYQPTEIRAAAAHLIETADRVAYQNINAL